MDNISVLALLFLNCGMITQAGAGSTTTLIRMTQKASPLYAVLAELIRLWVMNM
jgi:hypothetical protein